MSKKKKVSPNLYILELYNQRLFLEVVQRIRNNDITIDELQSLIVTYTGMYAQHKELIRNQLFIFQDGIDPLTGLPLTDFNYHHIIKDEYGGSDNFNNGVLLNIPAHNFLHNEIELHDPTTFKLLTECLFYWKDIQALGDNRLLNQWRNEVQSEYNKALRLTRHK